MLRPEGVSWPPTRSPGWETGWQIALQLWRLPHLCRSVES